MSQNQTNVQLSELIQTCDAHIKAGRLKAVTEMISKLNLAQVPRAYRQPLAKICRRAGLVHQGLRLLHPVIRHEKQMQEAPTPAEICEYSVLLSRNGSIDEALALLKDVDPELAPEAMLFQSYCYISTWECERASELLEKYLQSGVDDYSKLIARVNLASCYLATRDFVSADRILNETIELANQAGAERLAGNCFQLRGQMHVHCGDFLKARADLDRALSIFGQSGSYDQLLSYKWQSVMTSLESQSVEPLIQFRKEALQREHWESVREADLFSLKAAFDQFTFDHLIFGTPMGAYRDRIRSEVDHEPSSSFTFGKSGTRLLDLEDGKMKGAGALNPGKKIHQVIQALAQDFYVPRNIGTLFSSLYPEEYFNIDSSPLRIHQVIQRTRRWLEENHIAAMIQQSHGGYKLLVQGDFGIRMSLDRSSMDSNRIRWEELKFRFAGEPTFRSEEACQALNLSRAGFHRLAAWAIEAGELERSGAGKSTFYRVIPRSTHIKPGKKVA